jgi:hypothetical protein
VTVCVLAAWALFLAATHGCRGCGEGAAPPADAVPAEEIRQSWPWLALGTDDLDPALLDALAGRWLGASSAPEPAWAPPGGFRAGGGTEAVPTTAAAARLLEARAIEDDARAVEQLGAVYVHASCRLAREPSAFGAEFPDGWIWGARACEALGDAEGSARARANGATDGAQAIEKKDEMSKTALSAQPSSLIPMEVREVQVLGETLRYPLVEPAAFKQAAGTLRARAESLRLEAAAGPTPAMLRTLLERAASSRWSVADAAPPAAAGAPPPALPTADDLLAAAPAGDGRRARVEDAAERAIARWSAGLAALATEPRNSPAGAGPESEALSREGRVLLERWFRRSLYRDLGLRALEEGDSVLAVVALDEASGTQTRPRPGPGLDPLLLLALARARYEANELQLAAEILDAAAAVPGWEIASAAARTVARLAVLPSTSDPRVNR